jgi:hypothetical protein
MKSTEHFQNAIKAYLDQRSADDVLFSLQYSKPEKNIDDCITYILNTVKKSGCHGFADDEIYSMAVDYYDEDSIEVGQPMNCNVVVNHIVELTEDEKQEARGEAIKKVYNEVYSKMKQPLRKPQARQTANTNQLSLF